MIDNSSIVAKSSTTLPASKLPLIFLVFFSSSISTVFRIDNVVGDLHITFLNSKIVKVKMLLKKSPLLQFDLLDILSSQNFLFTSLATFSVFWGKSVRKKHLLPKPLHYIHVICVIMTHCVQKLICDSPIIQ